MRAIIWNAGYSMEYDVTIHRERKSYALVEIYIIIPMLYVDQLVRSFKTRLWRDIISN